MKKGKEKEKCEVEQVIVQKVKGGAFGGGSNAKSVFLKDAPTQGRDLHIDPPRSSQTTQWVSISFCLCPLEDDLRATRQIAKVFVRVDRFRGGPDNKDPFVVIDIKCFANLSSK